MHGFIYFFNAAFTKRVSCSQLTRKRLVHNKRLSGIVLYTFTKYNSEPVMNALRKYKWVYKAALDLLNGCHSNAVLHWKKGEKKWAISVLIPYILDSNAFFMVNQLYHFPNYYSMMSFKWNTQEAQNGLISKRITKKNILSICWL